jgi:hypothetical protein
LEFRILERDTARVDGVSGEGAGLPLRIDMVLR